ncbi:hypothetical protein [Boseongicola aestuarii]|uniref:hypothetical protein n=1 Tax=Boseongicola aestuarii TaxID=1470561 RepID=UPI000BB45132|nr:hypothetical protein [Boseongicola aestuarii]
MLPRQSVGIATLDATASVHRFKLDGLTAYSVGVWAVATLAEGIGDAVDIAACIDAIRIGVRAVP